MPEVETKKYSFEWFKEKTVEALINVAAVGLIGVIAWALVISYVGDSKWDAKFEQFKVELEAKSIDRHNQAVKREAEIIKMIQELQQKANTPAPPPLQPALPPLPILPPPHVPNVQQSPDSAKLEWMEKHLENFRK